MGDIIVSFIVVILKTLLMLAIILGVVVWDQRAS